ncbi:MAG TPA: NADH-quinone oxidoreductase subunit C, partial [Anaerolineales bacterium]
MATTQPSANATESTALDLAARFPGIVTADARPGFSGWIVDSARLSEIVTALRDELGYDLLTSLTAVDYFPENRMEVVYHAFKTIGGPVLNFKVQLPRVDPIEVASVTPIWAGAEFQEREAWDLYGIKFSGHPDLRRILMWEGFEGHPMRKDWKEGFYEEDTKPFKSRWPDGNFYMAEEKNPFKDNLTLPKNFDLEKWIPEGDEALYGTLRHLKSTDEDGIQTDHILVNMGPQHPSTHGVFRAAVVLNGEEIAGLKPVVGYLHRNHEKIGERNTYLLNMPYTDRLDYFNSMSNNFGYALAVEKLMNIPVAERADYIRVIMAEL